MDEEPNAQRTRRLVLALSGLLDMLLGASLVAAWAGVLPVDLSAFGLPRWVVGVVGGLFFLSGTAVAAWQLTKPTPPE
jgi:hypothetical protein